MIEQYERSKLKRHIRKQLQEIGFKQSKASKLIGAGEFYAKHHDQTYYEFNYLNENELTRRQNLFLNEYFKNISKLYELFRMSDMAVDRVRREFLNDNKVYSQAELEKLGRSNPKDEHERRGRKTSHANLHETHSEHVLGMHELMAVIDDADDEASIEQPEFGQQLMDDFFGLFASEEMDRCLSGFAPSAQAHMIDEIKAGIPLLEEFIRAYKTIDVAHIY